MRLRSIALASLFLLVTHLYGQVNVVLKPTSIPASGGASIDVGSLDLQLSFPIISKAGRGVPMHFGATAHTNFWTDQSGQWMPTDLFGWQLDPSVYSGSFSTRETQTVCRAGTRFLPTEYVTVLSNRTFIDGNGISHFFNGSQTYNGCTGASTTFPAATADGYSIDTSYTIHDPAGDLVDVPEETDTNGNFVTLGPDPVCSDTYSSTFECYKDTLGEPALVVDGVVQYPIGQAPIHYIYQDTAGHPQAITVQFATYTVQTNFGIANIAEYPATSQHLVSSITYQDGSSYSFTYEATPGYPGSVTGRIASMKLPTGGTITYRYTGSNDSMFNDTSSSGLTETTSDGTVTYSRTDSGGTSGGGATTTTIQRPSGVTQTYQFWQIANAGRYLYLPISIGQNGTVTSICYSSASYTCATSGLTTGITERKTTLTLNNGSSRIHDEFLNSTGLPTEVDEYDYGASTASIKTITQYASLGYIFNKPSSVTTTDGSGNTLSTTTYTYDEGTPVATSGLVNHNAVTSSRGNLTTESQWLNTTNSFISAHYTYDDAGVLQTATDFNTNTTTYHHDSTDTFVTETDSPQLTTGVTIKTYAQHDVYAGLLSSTTDANGHKNSFTYYSSLRPDTATYSDGDGGVTTFTYPSFNQISKVTTTGSASADEETIADGLGRIVRVAIANGQASQPWYVADKCFDSDGRAHFDSLRYQAANLTGAEVCSGSGNTYAYDLSDRLLTVTHTDGSVVRYSYYGRAIEATDEGNGTTQQSRIIQSDGLGRASFICEKSTTANLPGSPAPVSCGSDLNVSGQDPNATGFLTSYSYNPAAFSMTTSQSGQKRSWTLDSFGRLVSDSQPERTQPTTYQYTFAPAGMTSVRTAVATNQPASTPVNSLAYTHTTFKQDQLGRPLSIGYDDGKTPAVTYTYDLPVSGVSTSHNLVGRLVSISNSNASDRFSYKDTGAVEWKQTCTPLSCSGGAFAEQDFSYDLAGRLSASSDGAGRSVTYGYTQASEIQTITQSSSNSYQAVPATLLSSAQYTAAGPSSLTFGNNTVASLSFDSRQRQQGYGLSSQGTALYGIGISWTPDGSVATSCSSDLGWWSNGCASSSGQQVWTYGYNEFDRLASAQISNSSPSISYTYGFDVWGNRWKQDSTGPSVDLTFNTANNQILSGGTSPIGYDAAGNLTADPWGNQYVYDAESRRTSSTLGSATEKVAYGPTGKRVEENRNGTITDYTYTPDGRIAALWGAGGVTRGYLWMQQQQLGFYDTQATHFLIHDWHGSTRAQISASGTMDFSAASLPFGDGYTPANSTNDTVDYGALSIDWQTSTAHSETRDYSWQSGTWSTPDPSNGSFMFGDPGSFNRYSYAEGNPVTMADPSGLSVYGVDSGPDLGGDEEVDPAGQEAYASFFSGKAEHQCTVGTSSCGSILRSGWNLLTSLFGGGGVSPGGSLPISNSISTFVTWSRILPPPEVTGQRLHLAFSQMGGNSLEGNSSSTETQDKELMIDNALYNTGTFASGAGDVLTYVPFYGSLTKKANELDGGASSIGYNSGVYTAGKATGIALGVADLAAGGATGAALADGKTGSYFGRVGANGPALFNGGIKSTFRFGWGWNNNLGPAGKDIIRLGIGAARGTSWYSHITFWVVK
jgi:RHS repeat-associated protein